MLDPSISVDDIPNKRLPKHVNIFRQGELSRLVVGVLREADGRPLSTLEIVAAIMEKEGIGSDAKVAIRARVRSNLAYLERSGKVAKVGNRLTAQWHLPLDAD
ncbi:hypothetical protein [Hyphomicrobium sp. NDB2Meth4]|uniref:hypothetical protein n=1 Tax=Hyphomicrobium sp. NDB2Meth4 TaxID=1892846 RepID=UPI000931536D|nr:hypothetical protein [Hyphomicrobium sp. NDB2Meth4]